MNETIENVTELVRQARTLTKEHRKAILMSFPETELHSYLKELFVAMEPSFTVEVTHGPKELGKDLVIVKQDNISTDVIGVVVKCGNIKAKTLGEVDEVVEKVSHVLASSSNKKTREIESQIRQAFAHEAELKDFFKTLPVDKVFVIVAGEISKEGRIRLKGEVEGYVEIFALDWLIEKFSKFYPQIFFEGKITDFLQGKIQELETKHRVIKSNKLLSECFVDPVVRITDVSVDFGEQLRAIINRKELPFSRLKSFLSTHKQIILIGDPGTGKSAALAKLAIDLLKEVYCNAAKVGEKRDKTAIPILVTAREILAADSPESLLEAYSGNPEILGRLNIKTLMVDGLDEVVSDKRAGIIHKAKEYAEQFNCSLLISSRKIDILNTTPIGFEKLELLPFGAGQALQLLEKIHNSGDALGTLRNGLDNIKYQIPMVPLSLILLIEIVEEHKEIPASVTELYERYNDSVLGRYDKEKGIEVLFEYLIKKRFLADLAFSEFSSKNLIEIEKDTFDLFLKNYAEEYGFGEEEFEKFVKEIERAGVLEIGEETVLFRHRSFLDYFVAFYIYDKRDEFDQLNEFIVQIYFNDSWGEASFFYVGLKREINEKLLESILNYDRDSLWINMQKVMSGRLLQAGWHSQSKVKSNGIEKALSFVPAAREKLYRIAEKGKWPEPKIMVDLLLLTASDYSFRSGFLAKELQQQFDKVAAQQESTDLSRLIYLLWVMRPFINPENLREKVERILALIAEKPEIEAEEKLRATILLTVIKGSDKVLTKSINKRLTRLREQHPKEFKNLLPPAPTKKEKFNPPVRRK